MEVDGAEQPIVVAAEERLEYLVGGLGNNHVAQLLHVSKSQPSRWRSGKDRMSADSERRLLDLDYVMARLLRVMPPALAKVWLESPNPWVGGRPIDALRLRGLEGVLGAIEAEEQGAYF